MNGSYKEIFDKAGLEYFYAEFRSRENPANKVEVTESGIILCHDNEFDFIISGQMLEHCEDPIQAVSEACRVLKRNGLFFLVAPSSGPDHKYPIDCYRFYPDSFKVFAKKTGLHLLNLHHSKSGVWHDLSGTFIKKDSKSFSTKNTEQSYDYDYTSVVQGGQIVSPQGVPTKDSIDKTLINLQAIFNASNKTPATTNQSKSGKDYLSVLAEMHQLLNPRKYVEIGVQKGNSLLLSNSELAIGIDPAPIIERSIRKNEIIFRSTSDRHFRDCDQGIIQDLCENFDLAFIDGMHLAEYVLRDFINLEKRSHKNSIIVIDDVLPPSFAWTSRIRKTQHWCGDTWKIITLLLNERKDLSIHLIDCDPSPMAIVKNLDRSNSQLEEKLNRIEKNIKLSSPTSKEYAKYVIDMDEKLDDLDDILGSGISQRQ